MNCEISINRLLRSPIKLMSQPRGVTLALAGLMAIGVSLGAMQSAIAEYTQPNAPAPSVTSRTPDPFAKPKSQISPAIVSALQQDLSQQTGIPAKKLRVVETAQKSWPNGCLGLAKAGEMCTQMIVNGWRVVFTNGTQRWVYHTNATGTVYRLANSVRQSSMLPNSADPGNIAQLQAKLRATRIPVDEMPPKLANEVVFRAIASGGFTGRTYQTTLLSDGRLIRAQIQPDGSLSQPQTAQIGLQKVQEFQQALKQHAFQKFHRFNYSATPGSADYMTMTLSSRTGTVRYADTIRDRLPNHLQAIIDTWNQLSRS